VAKRLVVLVALSLALPATAFAATVHVRVEGKTRTLFAPAEVTVTASNALEALQQAALLGELYVHVTTSSFGNYVDQVGYYGGSADSGWVFKVDNTSPPVGADQVRLKDGDTVLWYYATFGPSGGPPTLTLTHSGAAGCYTVAAWDDNGKPASVSGVSLHVGSKRVVPAKLGSSTCVGAHRGLLVRATAIGAVRSNALV
jgi:Domain of unknown function (DUF4430)